MIFFVQFNFLLPSAVALSLGCCFTCQLKLLTACLMLTLEVPTHLQCCCEILCRTREIVLKYLRDCTCPQYLTLVWSLSNDFIQWLEAGAFSKLTRWYLFMEEMYVFGIRVKRASLQDELCDIL